MSIASPETREDLKAYRASSELSAQVNVSDEQMDVAINDAFQWFYERQHFNATEQVYLSIQSPKNCKRFKTGEIAVTQAVLTLLIIARTTTSLLPSRLLTSIVFFVQNNSCL